MDDISIGSLVVILLVCLLLSSFFSAIETATMALNRYKLKHLAENGDKKAQILDKLLKNPDRLLGAILLGNNFVNITATSVATVLGIKLFGEVGVLISTIFVTVVVLIFGEVTPKTLAAINPQKIAFPVAKFLKFLIFLLHPIVFLINKFALIFLYPLGIRNITNLEEKITNEELKTLVQSNNPPFSPNNSDMQQDMLLGVLELEDVSVAEVMVQRRDIEGIDLAQKWEEILRVILASHHGRLVVFNENLDKAVGILHLRDILPLIHKGKLDKKSLVKSLRPCVFVPDSTPLKRQLIAFKEKKVRSGLVVDEYGDIQGLVTLEDILSHIIGDLALEDDQEQSEIICKAEKIFVVEGTTNLRHINRELGLKLPIDEVNTLNGLIIETIGNFPQQGTLLNFADCQIKVLSFADGVVGSAEIKLLTQ